MRDFIYVEGEFRLNMLVLALGIAHRRAIFGAQPGKLDRNSKVGGLGVPTESPM